MRRSGYMKHLERVLLTLSLRPTQNTSQLAKICGLSNQDMAPFLCMMRSTDIVASGRIKGDQFLTWKLTERGKKMAVSGERPDEEKGMYYVFGIGKGAPNVDHKTYEIAEKEAMRLAKQHPGTSFRVVKVVADVCLPTPQPEVVKY